MKLSTLDYAISVINGEIDAPAREQEYAKLTIMRYAADFKIIEFMREVPRKRGHMNGTQSPSFALETTGCDVSIHGKSLAYSDYIVKAALIAGGATLEVVTDRYTQEEKDLMYSQVCEYNKKKEAQNAAREAYIIQIS